MKPPRGIAFYGLNIVRAGSILFMIMVFISSIAVLIHDIKATNDFLGEVSGKSTTPTTSDRLNSPYVPNSTVPNQAAGEFWAVTNRLLIMFQVIVLLWSETGVMSGFFDKWFPILGTNFGTGSTGVIQILLVASILSHHSDVYALLSSFLLFGIAWVNIAVGIAFRQKGKYKRAFSWPDESTLPTHAGPPPPAPDAYMGSRPGSYIVPGSYTEKVDYPLPMSANPYGFGKAGERAAALRGFAVSKPTESLPRYAPKANVARNSSMSSTSSSTRSLRTHK